MKLHQDIIDSGLATKFEMSFVTTNEELSKFLGLQLDENTALSIWKKFSKDNVRKIIADNDKSLSDKISKKQEIDANEIVNLGRNNYRSFDLNTGFQTGHISQRKSGDWERLFSDNEKKILNNQFKDWLIEFEYI